MRINLKSYCQYLLRRSVVINAIVEVIVVTRKTGIFLFFLHGMLPTAAAVMWNLKGKLL